LEIKFGGINIEGPHKGNLPPSFASGSSGQGPERTYYIKVETFFGKL